MQMSKKAVRDMLVRAIERCEEMLDEAICNHDDLDYSTEQETAKTIQASIVLHCDALSRKLVLLQSILVALDEQEKAEQLSYANQQEIILSILESLGDSDDEAERARNDLERR